MTKNRFFFLLPVIIMVLAVSSCYKTTKPDQVAKPRFNPPGGSYDNMQFVTVSSPTLGSTVHYTLDGSEPNSSSPIYSDPILISENTSIKAIAFMPDMKGSKIAMANYDINYDYSTMVYVPGGTFHNGTSDVTVSSFYIGKYEVTQAEYQVVMGSNPSYFSGNPNHPVECVSFSYAVLYCNRRSALEGLTPCYRYGNYGTNPDNWPARWRHDADMYVSCSWTANGYRLPTEAEWEYAARGGLQTHGYTFSGSNDNDAVAWYLYNSDPRTQQVGTKLPNELGIYDMSGNVWEWCWDSWYDYPSSPQTNPHGEPSYHQRVRRGGSWNSRAYTCAVLHRGKIPASKITYDVGLRLCRNSP
ncbi:MAG: SUMF1/EgtB/PvdO family nonheme iron enzyme [Candidatus Cloacimonadaceae bacterium]|jgi:formylglycine-generating enzyme required for sulfatase activity|nr:SUMF1/EgtB/PvdO family nonheme iron enzyme [Candidatus Cloacimonadota bacterium]MDX9949370.1 SUMF1/EgtB/PvdO family nonheme iron enzyme [Candidatus Syntrophosphaera sp.]